MSHAIDSAWVVSTPKETEILPVEMSFDSTKTSINVASVRLRAALLESQRRVLERIACGAPLEEILETLVGLIEEQADGMLCAVLLADARHQRLQFAAA